MRILDRAVYVGPSLYAHFPVIRLELDLGALEEWPTAKLGPAFIDRLLAALPGLHEHGCSYGEPGGFVRRLSEDEGTWLGHVLEHVAIELQNVAGEPVTFGKTRGAGAPGHVPRRLRVRAGGRRPRGRPAGPHPAPLAAAARAPARGLRPRRLRLRRRARRVHPLRPAARARAEHHVARARGRGAANPVDPAQRAEPDPVRPRPVPAAHPGHRHEPHVAHRGRARLRQGGDQPHPRPPRPAGAAPAAGAARGRRGRGGRADRLSGGGEAVQRQPRPRRLDPPHDRGAGADGVRDGARAQPERHRRELHHRRRPPHAGGQRRAGRRVEAGARPRRGRRRAHRSSSWWRK